MRTVLIVDDYVPILDVLSDILNDAGFDTVSTNEPERAKKLCSEVSFDVIISDLVMQHGSRGPASVTAGLELIMHIRHKFPDLPIIAMSGAVDEDALNKLTRLGVKGFLKKPWRLESVVSEIKCALGAAEDADEIGRGSFMR